MPLLQAPEQIALTFRNFRRRSLPDACTAHHTIQGRTRTKRGSQARRATYSSEKAYKPQDRKTTRVSHPAASHPSGQCSARSAQAQRVDCGLPPHGFSNSVAPQAHWMRLCHLAFLTTVVLPRSLCSVVRLPPPPRDSRSFTRLHMVVNAPAPAPARADRPSATLTTTARQLSPSSQPQG